VSLLAILKELWQRRLLVAAAAFVAAFVAALVVYELSIAPPSLAKRDHVEASGSVEILVDSAKSPIADVGRDLEPLTARAGVFARYIAGGNVIDKIAAATGIPPKEIEVAGPAPLPGEATGATAPPPRRLPYGIEVAQRDALPILNVVTRAPTLEEARELAAAAPAAVREIVTSIQQQQGIPDRKRVTFRVLGPAQSQPVTEALGAKIALMIFLVIFGLLVLLILGVPRLIGAWRALDAGGSEPEEYPPPLTLEPPADAAEQPSSTRMLASASIAAAEDIVERAQLDRPAARRGDG
jgi:hypothetical protein